MAEPAFRAWNQTKSDTTLDAEDTSETHVSFQREECRANSACLGRIIRDI